MGRSLKVYAIYDPEKFTKELVLDACKEDDIELVIHDGYSFEWLTNMLEAQEIWCFGNCRFLPAYVIAKSRFLDCWQMG